MEFNLADLWERVADTVPEREAIVDGARRFTYAQVDARANALAHVFAERGIGPGDHVGIQLHNGTEYLEVMLAAFKLRAVPVNVNYRYVAEELRYLFADAGLVAVVADREFAAKLDAVRDSLPALRTIVYVDDIDPAGPNPAGPDPARPDSYEHLVATASGVRDFAPRSGDDLYLLYTGGTTGMPKGVMWRHEDVFFGAMGGGGGGGAPIATPEEIADRCLDSRTRVVPACPFMHGTAHWMAFSVLFLGGTVVIDRHRSFDPDALWQLVAAEQATFIVIVGDAFARPLVESLDPALDVSSLRVVLSGGAILSPAIKGALVDLLPGVIVVDGYGASETGGQGQSITVAGGDIASSARFSVSDDTTVLDEDLRPAAPGIVGRLARRGRIPIGYWGDPDKTAATFPVDEHGVRWSVPGDHARIETDGTITLLGRGSVSINTGGEKVYPEEVEAALKSHPSVFDAVVVGVADERFGERVVAVVQARPGRSTLTHELQAHLRPLLAGYKIPRAVVSADCIERAPSGKPDYRWARRTAEAALGLAHADRH